MLILGIFGGVLLSVIFGIIALNQIKRSRQGGRGMSIAGLVLSGLWTLLIIAIVVLAIVFDDGSVRATDIKTGDCIETTPADGSSVARLPKVSCDEPHEGEVYAMIRVSGDETAFPASRRFETSTTDGACRRWSRTHPVRQTIRASPTSCYIPHKKRGIRETAMWPASQSRRTSQPALSKSDIGNKRGVSSLTGTSGTFFS